MSEEKRPKYRISRGKTKRAPTGMKLEEEWLTVEGESMKEVSEEFDKRWKDG